MKQPSFFETFIEQPLQQAQTQLPTPPADTSTQPDQPPTQPPADRPAPPTQEQVQQNWQRLVQTHGSPVAAGMYLLGEQAELREDRRQARLERDQAQSQVPTDGKVVISKADHDDLQAYRAHGTPKEVGEKITAGTSALESVKKGERQKFLDDALGNDYNTVPLLEYLPAGAELITEGDATNPVYKVKLSDTETLLADDWAKKLKTERPYLSLERQRTAKEAIKQPGPRDGGGEFENFDNAVNSLA